MIEQLPAREMDHGLAKQKDLIEKILLTVSGVGLTVFVIILIWLVVTDIILGKGQIAGGILGIAFILGMATSLALLVYRQVLINSSETFSTAASNTTARGRDTTARGIVF